MNSINHSKTVGESIQEFYSKNDFGDDGGINKKFVWIKFGFFSMPLPNTESRKNNVYLHDIHHIITDNNTNWKGESAVSAWEISSGGWQKFMFPWLLTLWAMGLGILFFRKSTLSAFENGLTMKNALTCGLSRTEMSNYSVSELRAAVSNQSKGTKNAFVWSSLSVVIFVMPFLLTALFICGIIFLL
jgi:hypothetical protein